MTAESTSFTEHVQLGPGSRLDIEGTINALDFGKGLGVAQTGRATITSVTPNSVAIKAHHATSPTIGPSGRSARCGGRQARQPLPQRCQQGHSARGPAKPAELGSNRRTAQILYKSSRIL